MFLPFTLHVWARWDCYNFVSIWNNNWGSFKIHTILGKYILRIGKKILLSCLVASVFWTSSFLDIFTLYETHKNQLADSFIIKVYVSLIRKCSLTHTDGLAVVVKEVLLLARDSSLKNPDDSYISVRLDLFYSMSCLFYNWSPPTSSFSHFWY